MQNKMRLYPLRGSQAMFMLVSQLLSWRCGRPPIRSWSRQLTLWASNLTQYVHLNHLRLWETQEEETDSLSGMESVVQDPPHHDYVGVEIPAPLGDRSRPVAEYRPPVADHLDAHVGQQPMCVRETSSAALDTVVPLTGTPLGSSSSEVIDSHGRRVPAETGAREKSQILLESPSSWRG